jgi:hypothetical protein
MWTTPLNRRWESENRSILDKSHLSSLVDVDMHDSWNASNGTPDDEYIPPPQLSSQLGSALRWVYMDVFLPLVQAPVINTTDRSPQKSHIHLLTNVQGYF